MANTVIEQTEPATASTRVQQPQAPVIDSASAVAEAARIILAQQAAAVSTTPAEVSPDVQAWIAEVAQRSNAGAGEVLLWLVAMIAFLAMTTAGIWLNAMGTFPHF